MSENDFLTVAAKFRLCSIFYRHLLLRILDFLRICMEKHSLACVASVSNRVIARKLERKQKKVEGGGEKRKRLPANPMILENAP